MSPQRPFPLCLVCPGPEVTWCRLVQGAAGTCSDLRGGRASRVGGAGVAILGVCTHIWGGVSPLQAWKPGQDPPAALRPLGTSAKARCSRETSPLVMERVIY